MSLSTDVCAEPAALASPAAVNGAGPKTLIFRGGSATLAAAVARELAGYGADVIFADDLDCSGTIPEGMAAEATEAGGRVRDRILKATGEGIDTVHQAAEILGGLDVVVNLYAPRPDSDPAEVLTYPGRLLARSLAAAKLIVAGTSRGSIINQCFLPAIYAESALEDVMPAVKGAITGLTRTLCRRHGRQGLRANGIQAGLIDLPEIRPAVGPIVKGVAVPTGRWGTAEDVAALVGFFAIEDHYMTGQVVILDGGLTAGLTGT